MIGWFSVVCLSVVAISSCYCSEEKAQQFQVDLPKVPRPMLPLNEKHPYRERQFQVQDIPTIDRSVRNSSRQKRETYVEAAQTPVYKQRRVRTAHPVKRQNGYGDYAPAPAPAGISKIPVGKSVPYWQLRQRQYSSPILSTTVATTVPSTTTTSTTTTTTTTTTTVTTTVTTTETTTEPPTTTTTTTTVAPPEPSTPEVSDSEDVKGFSSKARPSVPAAPYYPSASPVARNKAPVPVPAASYDDPANNGAGGVSGSSDYDEVAPPAPAPALPPQEATRYYYPPRLPLPLAKCFHNPTGYVCCNEELNDLMVETFTDLEARPKFHTCNIQRLASELQNRAQNKFNASFETIAALEDFAQKIHFNGDLVCKVELGGRYLLAYATVKGVSEANLPPLNGTEVHGPVEEHHIGKRHSVRMYPRILPVRNRRTAVKRDLAATH